MKESKLRLLAFIPAAIILVVVVIVSILIPKSFIEIASQINSFILDKFSGILSLTAFLSLLSCFIAYFSRLGNIRIGGENAKPMFSRLKSFYITLCTTIAAGIVFWGTVEPAYHLAYPPKSLNIIPFSKEAIKFTIETMFMHWTFNPYAIYTLPTIVFALAYFNMKKPFSVLSQFSFSKIENKEWLFQIVDAVCLLSLSAGIISSFMTVTINIGGAISSMISVKNVELLRAIILIIMFTFFTLSSISGLAKGINLLSNFNIFIYFIILIFVILFGPFSYSLNSSIEAFGGYLSNFFDRSLMTGAIFEDPWSKSWTTFYWSNWIAWAPISACFLGRLAYGHRVKDVILYTFIYPSIFSVVWITFFSGYSIYLQITNQIDVISLINNGKIDLIPYVILKQLPLGNVLVPFFLIVVFISFVTSANSMTNVMAAISSTGITPDNQEANMSYKLFWGISITIITYIMLKYTNIDGIKMFSNFGGFPAMFFQIFAFINLMIIITNIHKDKYKNIM
ncbi:BCCT family transporter [Brachyspira sp.]|uniref:BCCT family transporter n=1 Tax=Brachyspira sp. TaxID=1977261 RepID=UPI00262160D6|nr:BCCT family transporter [Brachyspira sp.]